MHEKAACGSVGVICKHDEPIIHISKMEKTAKHLIICVPLFAVSRISFSFLVLQELLTIMPF